MRLNFASFLSLIYPRFFALNSPCFEADFRVKFLSILSLFFTSKFELKTALVFLFSPIFLSDFFDRLERFLYPFLFFIISKFRGVAQLRVDENN